MTLADQSIESPAKGTVEQSIAERKTKSDWMSPGVLRTIIRLPPIASFCTLLIPYMHYSRMKMYA